MEKIYKELEKFRILYYESIRNSNMDSRKLKNKIFDLEELIENNYQSINSSNLEELIENMNKNANTAIKKVNDLNDKTLIAINVITFVDDSINFLKKIL